MVTVTCDKCGTVLTTFNAVTHKVKCRARRSQVVYDRETRSADPLDNPTNRSNATPKPASQEAAMLKGIEGRRLLIDGDYRGAVAAFAAATNLYPKRVTIFHQGCVEVYEKLGEHLRAEADRRASPSVRPTPHSEWDRRLDQLEDIASKRMAANSRRFD